MKTVSMGTIAYQLTESSAIRTTTIFAIQAIYLTAPHLTEQAQHWFNMAFPLIITHLYSMMDMPIIATILEMRPGAIFSMTIIPMFAQL